MLKILLACLSIALLVQEEPTISWYDNVELEWSDFQAEPEVHADVIAVTASGLSFGYSTKRYNDGGFDYDFNVTAHFYPERSYYLKEHVTNVTLSHERLHFDITELYARKFRQRVEQTTFYSHTIDDQMEVIYNEINTELRDLQRQYDEETSHSRIVDKQLVWQKFIAAELDKLDAYE